MTGFPFGFRNLTYFFGQDSNVSKYFWSVKDSIGVVTVSCHNKLLFVKCKVSE